MWWRIPTDRQLTSWLFVKCTLGPVSETPENLTNNGRPFAIFEYFRQIVSLTSTILSPSPQNNVGFPVSKTCLAGRGLVPNVNRIWSGIMEMLQLAFNLKAPIQGQGGVFEPRTSELHYQHPDYLALLSLWQKLQWLCLRQTILT